MSPKVKKNSLKYSLIQITFATNLINVFNRKEPLSLCMTNGTIYNTRAKQEQLLRKNVKVSSIFSDSLTHFSVRDRGERLCWWCMSWKWNHLGQKHNGQGMKVLWRKVQRCVIVKDNAISIVCHKSYSLNFHAKISHKALNTCGSMLDTVCAAKNTFFSYLSMKLSCPLKLCMTEIKPEISCISYPF